METRYEASLWRITKNIFINIRSKDVPKKKNQEYPFGYKIKDFTMEKN